MLGTNEWGCDPLDEVLFGVCLSLLIWALPVLTWQSCVLPPQAIVANTHASFTISSAASWR